MQNSNPSSLVPETMPLTTERTAAPKQTNGGDECGEGGVCEGGAAPGEGLLGGGGGGSRN